MRRRSHVNKRASARRFKSSTRRTRRINVSSAPMRGGIRL